MDDCSTQVIVIAPLTVTMQWPQKTANCAGAYRAHTLYVPFCVRRPSTFGRVLVRLHNYGSLYRDFLIA
ncbi:NADH-dependent flavin oxidoreductase nadA [Fusarium oxysporum f. sp. albedinis]|nr:NADH-dependent flavin oxidoreductase nadA [Fusarium oxysporum f. sp. albedinis]